MIAVGFPWQHEHIPTKFMLDFVRSDLIGDSVILRGKCGDTCQSRNQIVVDALEIGVEYILFLDVDQGIPTDIRKKMDTSPHEITSGVAPHRGGEYLLIYNRNKDGSYTPIEMPSEIIEVDGFGFGCVKVPIEVFQKMEPPWFTAKYNKLGQLQNGNDFVFCQRAKEEGYKLYADPSIQPFHSKTVEVNCSDLTGRI